jgi:EAL domain-containing protein (putative c-di-GMP-specific phosphodiesterase class I)
LQSVRASGAWRTPLRRAREAPEAIGLAFQPVVDLEHGVVAGYEALARFAGPPFAPPDHWLEAARRDDCAIAIEARIIRAALEARSALPGTCFFGVNVTPDALLAPRIRDAFLDHRPLDTVVIELTEQTPISDHEALRRALAPLRAAGARVAVDDAGSGYASMERITRVRPEFVKVAREFVAGVDRDEAKAAVVETFGSLTSRLDARLVAEGVERTEELDALVRLGVPLAQGMALGVPHMEMRGIDPGLGELMRSRTSRRGGPVALATLMEHPPSLEADSPESAVAAALLADPEAEYLVLVDTAGRPRGLVSRAGRTRGDRPASELTIVSPGDSAEEVARRAITRPRDERFQPLICADVNGRYVGVVRVERLVDALTAA